jgi:type II secretory pathway pseudopilin PulG
MIMSIASLGIVGGLAGAALPQRATDADRVQRETVEQTRATEASEQAENAAGIGQTEEDSQTSERDADGRRLWEEPQRTKKNPPAPAAAEPQVPLAKDPSGDCGGQLDLVG